MFALVQMLDIRRQIINVVLVENKYEMVNMISKKLKHSCLRNRHANTIEDI